MTDQELFDHVVRAIVTQGAASAAEDVNGKLKCLYRDGKGRKCAAGHLIPDDKYDPAMENRTIAQVMRDWPGVVQAEGRQEYILSKLQTSHDEAALMCSTINFVEGFLVSASRAADRCELSAAVCRELQAAVCRELQAAIKSPLG